MMNVSEEWNTRTIDGVRRPVYSYRQPVVPSSHRPSPVHKSSKNFIAGQRFTVLKKGAKNV